MNWKGSILRRPALAALLLLSACASSGAPREEAAAPAEEVGEILKISYFRGLQDGRTKRLEPIYRVVMSKSWQDRIGESPREPLARAAPGRIYVGFLEDAEMQTYFRKLREFGIDKLKSRPPAEFNPEEFQRLAVDPNRNSYTRVFTIGTDKWAKSYYYADHHVPGGEPLIPIFTKCEAFVSRACENSINVRTMTDPLPGRSK